MDSNTEHGPARDREPDHDPVRRVVFGLAIGLYLLGVGGLVGSLVERIRFDYRRDPVVARYDATLRARQATLMAIERDVAHEPRPTSIEATPVLFVTHTEVDSY